MRVVASFAWGCFRGAAAERASGEEEEAVSSLAAGTSAGRWAPLHPSCLPGWAREPAPERRGTGRPRDHWLTWRRQREVSARSAGHGVLLLVDTSLGP